MTELSTATCVYLSAAIVDQVDELIAEHRLIPVWDDNERTLYLNPAAVVTVREVTRTRPATPPSR